MKNRGFTLIELLAVILILGIISLIAIPIIDNVVNDAKRSSFNVTIENIIKSIEEKCQIEDMKGITKTTSYQFKDGVITPNLDIKGSIPSEGVILVDNECNISFKYLANDKYLAVKTANSVSTMISEYDAYNEYEDGDTIYYDSVNNEICDNYHEDNSLLNFNGVLEGTDSRATTLNQTTCLKFYTFNDNKYSSTLNLILDHNTTELVSHSDLVTQLNVDTSNWVNEARILKMDDLEEILNNYSIYESIVDHSFCYCLDIGFPNKGYLCRNSNIKTYNYGWLYDRTSNSCTTYGCNNNAESTSTLLQGYWIEDLIKNEQSRALTIHSYSQIANEYKGNNQKYGVRPTITISKSLFSNN